MSRAITNQVFDYSQVSGDDKAKLIYFEGQLFKSRKRVADEIIKHGEILHGVQQVLANYSSGVFCEWLDASGTSSSSAYRAIDAYQSFDGFSQLGNLEVSAMYALAKNVGARKKAMRLANKGVKVTHAIAKQLIADCEPSPLEVIETGEDGRTDSDGTEPTEETAHQPAEDGTESAGEDVGATNTEWEDVEEEATDDTSIVLDAIGRQVPEAFREAHGLSAAIQVEGRKLDAILRKLKELSEEPGGEFIGASVIETELKALKGRIFGACYWSECPKCKGGKCGDCSNSGWWPKKKSGHLSVADKEWLGV